MAKGEQTLAKRLGKFVFFMLVGQLLGWFAIEGLLWIEFNMKPYTESGKIMFIWVQHILMISMVTIIAWGLSSD